MGKNQISLKFEIKDIKKLLFDEQYKLLRDLLYENKDIFFVATEMKSPHFHKITRFYHFEIKEMVPAVRGSYSYDMKASYKGVEHHNIVEDIL